MSCQYSVAHLLPPAFISVITTTMWLTYLLYHLRPMLEKHTPAECFSAAAFASPHLCRGIWQAVVSQVLMLLFVLCYTLCIVVSPGTVPRGDEWELNRKGPSLATTHELKITGDRRTCKWCQVYKPDRCHHCRICGQCVLRMDHHCPWIMNCVGFRNHKYFMLVVIYGMCACIFNAWTVLESVLRSIVEETLPLHRFYMVLCMVLSIIMGTLTTLFLLFHIWLMLRGMSTIEFCEKATRNTTYDRRNITSYDRGICENIMNVLGPNPLLWFLPVSLPEGEGFYFSVVGGCDTDEPSGACDVGEKRADPEWTTPTLPAAEAAAGIAQTQVHKRSADKSS